MTNTSTLIRLAPLDIEVIRSSSPERIIGGIVAPFDSVALVNDGQGPYREALVRGAFAKTIAERGSKVQLLSQHKRNENPLGKAVLLREDALGLYGEFRISKTQAGDEALTLVADGALDAFSVGFAPIRERKNNPGVVERTEVALREVSLVTLPAYQDALVSVMREESEREPAFVGLSIKDATARLEKLRGTK